jgi:hypothetical protein
VNQDGAVLTELSDALSIFHAGKTSDSNMARVRSLPSTTAFDVRLFCTKGFSRKFYLTAGLVLRESSTGKLITFAFESNGNGLSLNKWSGPTSFSASYRTAADYVDNAFFRVVLASGTLAFQYSADGVTWAAYHNVSATDYMASGPNQWGVYVGASNLSAPTMPVRVDARHWSEA